MWYSPGSANLHIAATIVSTRVAGKSEHRTDTRLGVVGLEASAVFRSSSSLGQREKTIVVKQYCYPDIDP